MEPHVGHTETVLRVYLDQNKWVDFTRCVAGLPVGARFADAWTMAREASVRGVTSFPLSAIHYMETSNRTKTVSRLQLAGTMAELSKLHTIAGSKSLIPVDSAVAAALDPQGPPAQPAQVFGVGFAHAFNLPLDWVSSQFDG